MITIGKLEGFGADVSTGLARCMGMEDFYLRMVGMALSDTAGPEKLKTALEQKDVKAAFEAAHAMKGVYANLSLTPVFEPVSELTEVLRAGSLEGTDALYQAFRTKYEELKMLAED